MYLDADFTESDVLRQGDIISDVELVGAFHINAIQRTLNNQDQVVSWSVATPLKKSTVIVLSHSCEIAPENNIKVTSVILAPIRDVEQATAPEKIRELIESNIIDPDNPLESYLKYFYLEPHERLGFLRGGIADFSKLFSVHKSSYDGLLRKKVLQLRPEIAARMAYKLALYFFREEQR